MSAQERLVAAAKADPAYAESIFLDGVEAARGCIVHGRAPDEMDDGMCPDCTAPVTAFAARVAHAFAIKYGLREHLTYEQAMALERDLTVHLRAWLTDPR